MGHADAVGSDVGVCYVDRRHLITDRICEGGNAIASVRPSVCPSVSFRSLRNRLTVDVELLRVSWS